MRRGCRRWPCCTTRLCGWGEIAGMRRRRRTLVAQAHGLVVEIGAGTGLKRRPLFRRGRRTHPHRARTRNATQNSLGVSSDTARVAPNHRRGPAERPSVGPTSCVDTVISTLVLCTVADPEGAPTRNRARTPSRWSVVVHRTRPGTLAVPRGLPRQTPANHGGASQAGACAIVRPSS